VTFSPTATGTSTGSVTINAGGVTNTVSLSGTGTAPGPVLSASPASLSFPATLVGSSPATQTVTVTNTGTTAATVSSVAITGAFSQTNNCTTIAVNGTCTVTVKFTPTAATNTGTLTVNSNANNTPLTVGLSGAGITSTTNIALNKPATASSDYESYVPANVTDGNTSTYWESADGAGYPQTITVDLGSTQSIGSVTLDLPPATAWSTRTETLSVLGSTNDTTFSQLVGSAGYTFNPSTGNTVTISLPSGTSDRYVELSFTGNTGWSAAQLSEFEVFPGGGSTGGASALSASPSSASFGSTAVGSTSAAQNVTVSNPGTTAASVSSVSVSGPFSQTNTCGGSIAAVLLRHSDWRTVFGFGAVVSGLVCCSVLSAVTRAVMLPFPVSGWRTKEKLSVTISPPGPRGIVGRQALPDFGAPPLIWQPMFAFAAANTPRKMVSSPARIMPITQPRTLRNLIHSARSREAKPPPRAPSPGPASGRGAEMTWLVIAAPPAPRRRRSRPGGTPRPAW